MYMSNPSLIEIVVILLVLLGISLGVFLLIRSIILWYWKIDKIVSNQQQQIILLQQQKDILASIAKKTGFTEGVTAGMQSEKISS